MPMSVSDEADAHAAEDPLNAGGCDSRLHGRRAQRQQPARRYARHTDALRIDYRVGKHLVEHHALVCKQKAVPAMAFEPQGLVQIVVRIAAWLHPDVFHGVHDVAGLRKVRGTGVLVAVLVIEDLRHLAVPHETNDRRLSFRWPGGTRL